MQFVINDEMAPYTTRQQQTMLRYVSLKNRIEKQFRKVDWMHQAQKAEKACNELLGELVQADRLFRDERHAIATEIMRERTWIRVEVQTASTIRSEDWFKTTTETEDYRSIFPEAPNVIDMIDSLAEWLTDYDGISGGDAVPLYEMEARIVQSAKTFIDQYRRVGQNNAGSYQKEYALHSAMEIIVSVMTMAGYINSTTVQDKTPQNRNTIGKAIHCMLRDMRESVIR